MLYINVPISGILKDLKCKFPIILSSNVAGTSIGTRDTLRTEEDEHTVLEFPPCVDFASLVRHVSDAQVEDPTGRVNIMTGSFEISLDYTQICRSKAFLDLFCITSPMYAKFKLCP
jgi:hypothetical protein